MKKPQIHIQKTHWAEVRKEFLGLNPVFTNIIDALSPKSDHSLFLIEYPFGELPMQNGYFYFPNAQGIQQPLQHGSISSEIRQELGYNQGAMPMGMILKNHFEMFLSLENHTIIPHGLMSPGHIFSTWRALSDNPQHIPNFLWNFSAGARSLFMLPKIAEKKRHDRLKKHFDIQTCIPKQLSDHWHIFKELAQSTHFDKPWSSKLVLFGKKWIESMDDPQWIHFKQFILQSGWNKTAFWRSQFLWDLVYSMIQKNCRLKPDPYIMDTVKYLLNIATGLLPGFAPGYDDNAAPISTLQKIYLEEYRLEHTPLILQPQFFRDGKPTYYSLEYPCAIEFAPSTRKISNKIILLHQIRDLLSKITTEISNSQWNLTGSPIVEALDKTNIDFFHNEYTARSGILSTEEVLINQKYNFRKHEDNLPLDFPANAPFLQGCIQFSGIAKNRIKI